MISILMMQTGMCHVRSAAGTCKMVTWLDYNFCFEDIYFYEIFLDYELIKC